MLALDERGEVGDQVEVGADRLPRGEGGEDLAAEVTQAVQPVAQGQVAVSSGRRTLARERGLPPYLVFNDRTLAELAARKPRTSEEFRRIKGVGDKKAADLGPLFLARIAELAVSE